MAYRVLVLVDINNFSEESSRVKRFIPGFREGKELNFNSKVGEIAGTLVG